MRSHEGARDWDRLDRSALGSWHPAPTSLWEFRCTICGEKQRSSSASVQHFVSSHWTQASPSSAASASAGAKASADGRPTQRSDPQPSGRLPELPASLRARVGPSGRGLPTASQRMRSRLTARETEEKVSATDDEEAAAAADRAAMSTDGDEIRESRHLLAMLHEHMHMLSQRVQQGSEARLPASLMPSPMDWPHVSYTHPSLMDSSPYGLLAAPYGSTTSSHRGRFMRATPPASMARAPTDSPSGELERFMSHQWALLRVCSLTGDELLVVLWDRVTLDELLCFVERHWLSHRPSSVMATASLDRAAVLLQRLPSSYARLRAASPQRSSAERPPRRHYAIQRVLSTRNPVMACFSLEVRAPLLRACLRDGSMVSCEVAHMLEVSRSHLPPRHLWASAHGPGHTYGLRRVAWKAWVPALHGMDSHPLRLSSGPIVPPSLSGIADVHGCSVPGCREQARWQCVVSGPAASALFTRWAKTSNPSAVLTDERPGSTSHRGRAGGLFVSEDTASATIQRPPPPARNPATVLEALLTSDRTRRRACDTCARLLSETLRSRLHSASDEAAAAAGDDDGVEDGSSSLLTELRKHWTAEITSSSGMPRGMPLSLLALGNPLRADPIPPLV